MEDKDLKNKLVLSVNKQCGLRIIDQMEKSICKIIKKGGIFGTGFFCNIPHQGQNLKVLITSDKVINKQDIYQLNKVKISLDDDKINKNIELNEKRTIYINKEDGIAIIEMNEKNEKENKDIIYLDLDDELYEKKLNNIYCKNKLCYVIQYTKNNKIAASYGNIKDINKSQIEYICSIGFPIFNLSNNKIIGIHKENNLGIMLNFAFKNYITKYFKNQNKPIIKKEIENEIDIKLKINKNDINKEIYFLDNIDIIDINGNIHPHNNLKELNEINSKIYINDKEEKYKKYFIPEKEGEYNIKLKFNINLIDCSFMFAGCKNIININFINFNTSNVKNMEYMFSSCSNLINLDLSKFDTINVENMEGMFGIYSIKINKEESLEEYLENNGCKNLKSINLLIFNTKNVKNMNGMFYYCSNLEYLDLSLFDINKDTDIRFMLYKCHNLMNVNGINIKYGNNKIFCSFSECDNLYEYKQIKSSMKNEYFNINEDCIIYEYKKLLKLNENVKINILNQRIEGEIKKDKNYFNSIIMQYKINQNDKKIKIFGYNEYDDCFLKSNEDKCKIVYNNKEYELNEYFDIDNLNIKNHIITIKIIGINNIINASYMFDGCSSLISLPDICKWNTINVEDMSYMFSGCSSLTSLPDISKWNTINVNNMSFMFDDCSSLTSLPDISKWNTDNDESMYGMFYGCSSLISLPDISQWNTDNVESTFSMFRGCSSLVSLPDISKWNINNVNNMSYMLCGCSSLKSLPDLSKWNTDNVIDMNHIFSGCSSLISLPDISKWNTNNVEDMSYMFHECSSLMSLPDISKWNTDNIKDMTYMFYECSSLISLADITKWNTSNVEDMSFMFDGCSDKLNIPKSFKIS